MDNNDMRVSNENTSSVTDILGYRLGEARVLLASAGIDLVSVILAAPPREKCKEYDDSYRVIKVELLKDNKLQLIVCKPL